MENELKQSLYRAEMDGFFNGVRCSFENNRGTIDTPFNWQSYDKEIRVEYADKEIIKQDIDPTKSEYQIEKKVEVIPTHLRDIRKDDRDLERDIEYVLEMLYNHKIQIINL